MYLSEIFQDMSATFSAALEFLTNLADRTAFLFILVHSVDCLSNLADNMEFLFVLVHNVECSTLSMCEGM